MTPAPADRDLEAVTAYANANPAALPPEFNGDPAKFIESWKNLRAAYTQATQKLAAIQKPEVKPEATPTPPKPPAVDPTKPLEIPASEAPVQSGDSPIDIDALEAEYVENGGKLKPETETALLQRLKTAGFANPELALQTVINGRVEQRKAETALAASAVGGEQNLATLIEWAKTNLNPAEKDAANAALKGPMAAATLSGLWARMQASRPAEPKPTPGLAQTGAGTVVPFTSIAEQSAAIRDPKYRTDANYRKMVEARIVATSRAGVNT